MDTDTRGETALPLSMPAMPVGQLVKISYWHYRYILDNGEPKRAGYLRANLPSSNVLPRGGKTVCTLTVDGRPFCGGAVCYMRTPFSREWALGAALENDSAAMVIQKRSQAVSA